ncbi:MAG TPA: division plane positioning ATPase MipZ [Xanthobacteraceae bacterium]|nr:division plane positioning ATPase MipZ [Xanthobacteraceae bacterium]
MSSPRAVQTEGSRVIVVANEKGGSGKSTVAIHIAVALIKAGHTVATIDLDSRQRSLTRYIENRREWAAHVGQDLGIPTHVCIGEQAIARSAEEEALAYDQLVTAVEDAAKSHNFIVIDTPGHQSHLTSLVHAMADTLITPLNDSFVDFDVLATVDPKTLELTGPSHYAETVLHARNERSLLDQAPTEWIVLRNRLSMISSRNKRLMGEKLQELSERLNFRCIDGIAERLIFREFYPRGLTAFDEVKETTLGTRPTLSHATARQEVQNLLDAMALSESAAGLDGSRHVA